MGWWSNYIRRELRGANLGSKESVFNVIRERISKESSRDVEANTEFHIPHNTLGIKLPWNLRPSRNLGVLSSAIHILCTFHEVLFCVYARKHGWLS